MRKIETKLTDIVLKCLHGMCSKSFDIQLSKRDRIRYRKNDGTVEVYLWNSLIALFSVPPNGGSMACGSISHCGYETVTTKSRLNAILRAFHGGRVSLFQKDFVWHCDVPTALDGKGATVEFDRLIATTGRYVFPVHL